MDIMIYDIKSANGYRGGQQLNPISHPTFSTPAFVLRNIDRASIDKLLYNTNNCTGYLIP